MITIRDLLRYEHLTGRSLFDGEPDGVALLYCTSPEVYQHYTLAQWSRTTQGGASYIKEQMEALTNQIEVLQQYIKESADSVGAEETDPRTRHTLKEAVTELLSEGVVTADYLLERAEMWEIPLFVDATRRKRQGRLERERLWSFVGLLPHIDTKKIKTPQDLFPFSWDADGSANTAENEDDLVAWNEARLQALLNN